MSGTANDRIHRHRQQRQTGISCGDSTSGGGQVRCQRLRVILLGDCKVGKTSLMQRFVNNTFEQDTDSTITMEEMEKKVMVDGRRYVLRVVDTAGQERFKSLRAGFYRGTHICLLTFAIDDLSSFCNLTMWREEFAYYSGIPPGSEFPFVVIGNKADLRDKRKVSDLNVEAWCHANGDVPYFETSAKQALNVNEVFAEAVRCFRQAQAHNVITSSDRYDRYGSGREDKNVIRDLKTQPSTGNGDGGNSKCCS